MKKTYFFALIINLITVKTVLGQDTTKIISIEDVFIFDSNKNIDITRLNKIKGTDIFSGKKNEVILINASTADLSTNNSRQIFAKIPGLSIWENDGSGIQTSIATRGLSPNRSWEFNVRQNGYDISSEVFGYPEAYYTPPSEALEQIEIVRGAGSLQYGPQFGGLLNYVTKKQLGNKPLSIESFQTIGSYGLYNTFNAIGGKSNKISYYVYFHQRSADGWRENSAYKTQTGSASLTYDISNKLKLTAEYTRMNYTSQQAGGLNDNDFSSNAKQSHRARNWFSTPWNTAAINLNYKPTISTEFSMRIFGVFAERNSVGFTKPITIADTINDEIDSYNTRQVDADRYRNYGIEIRGIKKYQLFKNESALSGGLRLYSGQTLRQQQGIGTTGNDYDMNISLQQNGFDYGRELTFGTQNMAAFFENMFQVTDKLAVTTGLRYEHIRAQSDGYINTTSSGQLIEKQNNRNILLIGIGAEYSVQETCNFYANFSQGYRPVLFSELTPSATTDVIDPNIKDATGHNIDFGFRGSLFKNLIKFDIGAFRLLYDNRIGTISVNNTPYRTNIGSSVSKGIESYIELNVMRLINSKSNLAISIFGNYSFIEAKYTRWENPAIINNPLLSIEGKRIENAPRHILRTGLTARFKELSATLQYNHISSVYTDAINSAAPNSTATVGQLPAYSLVDVNVMYNFDNVYQFRAGINNITDEKYATRRAGGYPGPGILPGTGRTFYFSIGFRL